LRLFQPDRGFLFGVLLASAKLRERHLLVSVGGGYLVLDQPFQADGVGLARGEPLWPDGVVFTFGKPFRVGGVDLSIG